MSLISRVYAFFKARKSVLLFSTIFIASCVVVRQADLDAWQNVPVIELESHPIFNAMELEKKPLSDGSTLWSYTKRGGTYQSCNSNAEQSASSVTDSKSRSRSSYDRHGYDRYGYDRYGYDKHGINKQGKHKTEVTSTRESSYSNSNCVTGEYVCVNQFLVSKSGMVLWYRPTGNSCYTDCSYRPQSRPCTK